MCELVDILIGEFFAVHLLDTVDKHATVQANKARLGKFADKCGNVFVLHVCICVKLRTGCSIRCFAIICQKLQLLESLAIFIVTLAIEHERLGDLIIILAHKSLFYLVLNILYSNTFIDIQVAEYL